MQYVAKQKNPERAGFTRGPLSHVTRKTGRQALGGLGHSKYRSFVRSKTDSKEFQIPVNIVVIGSVAFCDTLVDTQP